MKIQGFAIVLLTFTLSFASAHANPLDDKEQGTPRISPPRKPSCPCFRWAGTLLSGAVRATLEESRGDFDHQGIYFLPVRRKE